MSDNAQHKVGGLPDWLTVPLDSPSLSDPSSAHHSLSSPNRQTRALHRVQYEMIFPRVLELISEGYVLRTALRELPIEIHAGAFMRWLQSNPDRYAQYKEAKEIRSEVWVGEALNHAKGVDDEGNATIEEVARSRLVVDTYRWLVGADNRKVYGDTKTVEIGGTISIRAALDQATARLTEVSLADTIDVECFPSNGNALLGDGGWTGDDEDS